MSKLKLFEQISSDIELVLAEQPPVGALLWQELIKLHPADIAQLLFYLDDEHVGPLYAKLNKSIKLEVLEELGDSLKRTCLMSVTESDRAYLLGHMPLAELADFLDDLSDQELNTYLALLPRKNREQVLSLLKFEPGSAGAYMDINVLTLQPGLTVEKSVQIVQRLELDRDLHEQIFVTDAQNKLVGHIKLEDLVLKSPKTVLQSIMRPSTVVLLVDQTREQIAQEMTHYSLTIAPVIEHSGLFLGVIPSETLIDIVEQEASEDIYRMAAVVPIKDTYFGTSFKTLFYQRSSILVTLLLVQTFSTIIIEHYQVLLAGFLTYFLSMLTSTGGNASSQTSALAIQGMATGEINESTRVRFIKREFSMALVIGTALGMFSCARIYITHGEFIKSLAVSLSLSLIIIISMILGSVMPLILKRLKVDPAHSAGPLLTTLMDVIGLLIYCFTSKLILG